MDMMPEDDRRVIVAFISAMMTAVQVKKVAEYLGFRIIFVEDAAAISESESLVSKPPAEPLFGREAGLVEQITSWQPALLIFDLSNEAIPWRNWISTLKSSPATKRSPILCFGPHVDKETFITARELNVDGAVARSRFMSQMPLLIEEMASPDNSEVIGASCNELISNTALKGIEAFNSGHYFDAHEFLEEAWNEDNSASRNVYKGVLQIAVAYLHIERQNYRGAVKMFLRARQWLSPLPDICRGINIALLRKDADAVHQMIIKLGPGGVNTFDSSILAPLDYEPPG